MALSGDDAAYEYIAAISATDFRPDLQKIDRPTLVIHGDDDQIVPFAVGGKRSADLVKGAVPKIYEGGARGLPDTAKDRLHEDLLDFIEACRPPGHWTTIRSGNTRPFVLPTIDLPIGSDGVQEPHTGWVPVRS